MYSLLKFADGDFSRIENIPVAERNTFMSKMYAEGAKAYKEDETAKQEINDLAEQSFEPKSDLYTQIYSICKKWSFCNLGRAWNRKNDYHKYDYSLF